MSLSGEIAHDMAKLLDKLKSLSPIIDLIRTKSGAPGLSLGVLHHGEIIHTAHFGYRDVAAQLPPDDDTVYYMATLTKAVTSAAMAVLVDRGQVKWDTPVSHILPDFAQRTDEVGQDSTIIDILAHRTGLAAPNGLWVQRKQVCAMPKSETVRTCVHLQSVAPLRGKYLYNNWGYGLATEIIEKVSGIDFGTSAKQAIFDPLSMKQTRSQS